MSAYPQVHVQEVIDAELEAEDGQIEATLDAFNISRHGLVLIRRTTLVRAMKAAHRAGWTRALLREAGE